MKKEVADMEEASGSNPRKAGNLYKAVKCGELL